MIQPINASRPAPGFKKKPQKRENTSSTQAALINAGGIAALTGGITTLVTRSCTNSFAQAGVLGVFSAFLAMFFMTPRLIDKISTEKAIKNNIAAKEGVKTGVNNIKKPFRKMILFRAEKA